MFSVGNIKEWIGMGESRERGDADTRTDGWDGLTDFMIGGLGLAGGMFGGAASVGLGSASATATAPLLAAGAGGMYAGDALGKVMFGDMDENDRHHEEIPADGEFEASTGNRYVDGAIGAAGSAVNSTLDFFGLG
jgi:hypothetical protein